ncbi:MAG: galactarate dehydratase [Rhodoplanes sp.]|uniref:galactarate dehydratase n=1 Tax=Rhodoplanes sp. TaxID=1968906 RepID=UPI001825B5BF|nr:galactarate dehydratase [Rhodoplanes sp.]NVO12617.1 galactarate dehydratase [Rhodoplanes sp.]
MLTQAAARTTPLRIKLHADDNVAIVANSGGLPAGTVFDDGLTLVDHVPQGHKVALEDIPEGGIVRRYGEVIGIADRALRKGAWIDEFAVRLPAPPELEKLPLATKVPAPLPPLDGYTFDGYRNPDGSVGTRNILGISTSVHCVAGTVDYVVRLIKERLLPRYPNVDDVVGLNHLYGCGVAINAPAAVVPIRALQNIALNPNFGGEIMVISLGCEKLQPERLVPEAYEGAPDDTILRMQDERFDGFQAMVDAILAMAERHLDKLNRRKREPVPASELVVGMQCGGSDAFSGVTANPAVGFCSDLLVRAGATVMFSEVTEVRDAVHLLTPRCATPEIGRALIREMDWYDRYLAAGETDRSANPTPGNKKGGLANIVEKALGSIAKSGTSAISAVLAPGERATTRGLIFAATPASDFVCGTMQLASGITLQVFTTGRGTPYGLAAVPVIKMATRKDLSARWHDLIDIDAGRIATGEKTIEEIGWELFHLLLEVASGRKKPWSDHWGLHNALAVFNPAPVT